VPWLLKEINTKANGKWHITHSLEVERHYGDADERG
jgi:hypothetical protein